MSLHTRTLARPLPPLPDCAGPEAYLDIETTGLSPDSAQVTLVGLVYADGPVRRLEQFFADDPDGEAEVLRAAARRLRAFDTTVTYNGTTFDLPFLRTRARLAGVPWPRLQTYDLLQVARAWRQAYGQLRDCRLQTVMAHFQVGRQDETSGREMVEAYYKWLRTGIASYRDLILEHNAEDLLLLPDLVPCLTHPPQVRILGG
ncbi:MAG TPA: ribonuclease H-like domain-containing protein [Symbiobacteriaceae bacterium]|nr:ribonuclease H-like domain-containing protein [Symbiobacteriaceae bacterium]